jgi:hypothetical protein
MCIQACIDTLTYLNISVYIARYRREYAGCEGCDRGGGVSRTAVYIDSNRYLLYLHTLYSCILCTDTLCEVRDRGGGASDGVADE